MMTRILSLAVVVLALLMGAGELRAFQTNPVTSQGGGMLVTITGVEGMVQVREAPDKPWKKAVVGMNVTEGAEFRTGPKSAVRVLIPPDQTITLDRLGVIRLMQAIQDGATVKTRVGMPYGRTRYDIEEAGIEHQSELVSPSSTLAIRGTKVSIYDQPPFTPQAVSLTGRAEYRTAKRQVGFGGKGQGKTNVSSETDSPAQYSLLQTFVDPSSSFGRPEADQKLLNQLQSKGDVLLRNGTLAVAFGPTVTDQQLTNLISSQGRFNVSLRWFGPGDFDLFVLGNDAQGEPYTLGNPAYPGSVFKDIGFIFDPEGRRSQAVAKSPDGGRIVFDQVALGGGGIELASFDTPVPQIGFTIGIVYYDQRGKVKDYPVRQRFRLDAFLDGKPVPVLTNFNEIVAGTATELKFGPTYEGTASLLPGEQFFTIDNAEAQIKGAVDMSAVDLSIEAVGPINGQAEQSARARRAALERAANAKPVGPATPAGVAKPRPIRATAKAVKPTVAKQAPQPAAAAATINKSKAGKGR